MTSKILLENLKIYAYHGVFPEEKIIGTDYILNVEIHTDLGKASKTDNLKDTINYSDINDIIHHEMGIPSKLLEHVIGRIFTKLENTFPQITFVRVKLTKTNPPMQGEMDGVSVEMQRNFKMR